MGEREEGGKMRKEKKHLQIKLETSEVMARHGFPDAGREMHETGKATPAWRAWVQAVELEYGKMGKDVRVHLDMPISRKAFLLGWMMRDRPESGSEVKKEQYGINGFDATVVGLFLPEERTFTLLQIAAAFGGFESGVRNPDANWKARLFMNLTGKEPAQRDGREGGERNSHALQRG